jgi:hypothetical protein
MKKEPESPARPGKGEQWTPAQIERLAREDAEKLSRDPSEARAYVRRASPFLAALLEAEPEN